ncbi:MAG: tungsten formylmethanofuran dehydrogenase [Acidobacteria bacterium]|nr:tungsten formylmethanofuran dehydrogenase [Acidobacteriota bacterium]TDI51786.1 MAG: tungsten formylmethanofuran dehydrogenase [Acidobacteriota bacterium]TDI53974.1 MAG: tungsten formylmethanofuran dehydrogenase [Acidobacteriota bacterium]
MKDNLDHRGLGLTDDQLVEMYRLMLMTRRVDDRMWALQRQGRAAFVLGSSGHEAIQVASVFALDRAKDWILPYYRDMGVGLAWGFSPKDIFLGVFAKKDDPMSGGRQLPSHWSDPEKRVLTQSSVIGTQFPHAAGIAHGVKTRGSDAVVVVYGGEGATSEGDWHEAMNWAGIHKLPLIFVIENNHYAISVPSEEEVAGQVVDRAAGYGFPGHAIDGNAPLEVLATMQRAVARARAGEGPTLIEADTYRYYAHTSDDNDSLYRSRDEVETWRKKDPVARLQQYLIENRMLTEVEEAELDSSVVDELAKAVEQAESSPDPDEPTSRVYAKVIEPGPAVTEPEVIPDGERINLITAVNRTLHEVFEAHPDTIVFGEDVAREKGGVFKATQGLTERFGPERCFNTPIAESSIIGCAIGMAVVGYKVIPEIQFADYIHPAFNQIVSEAAKISFRSDGRWTVPIVIRTPYGAGIHGALYHSQSIESFYCHVPGLKVVVPSTPADVKGLLHTAVEDPDPVMFLEPKKLYRLAKGPFPEGEYKIPLGKAAIRHVGSDLTIIAYGAMAHFAMEAVPVLEGLGISPEVIDLRSLKPLDWATIEASIQKTSRALIVHEDNEFAGFGAEIAAQIADKTFEWLDAPVKRYALPDVPIMPYAGSMEHSLYPTPEGIVEKAQELAKY